MSEIKFRPYFSINWEMRSTKLKKTYAILVYEHLWTCSHIMVISIHWDTELLIVKLLTVEIHWSYIFWMYSTTL